MLSKAYLIRSRNIAHALVAKLTFYLFYLIFFFPFLITTLHPNRHSSSSYFTSSSTSSLNYLYTHRSCISNRYASHSYLNLNQLCLTSLDHHSRLQVLQKYDGHWPVQPSSQCSRYVYYLFQLCPHIHFYSFTQASLTFHSRAKWIWQK